jgi:hypothetical protein
VELIIPVESAKPVETVERFAAEQIRRWFEAGDQFLRWERANMLLAVPSPEIARQHRGALELLLHFIRAMSEEAPAADIDRETKRGLKLRLRKLEGSWNMFYEPVGPSEAQSIRQQCFPDEH